MSAAQAYALDWFKRNTTACGVPRWVFRRADIQTSTVRSLRDLGLIQHNDDGTYAVTAAGMEYRA